MSGYVYAVECGHAVKIGFATDPKKRFLAIKTATPHECELLGVVPGTRADERALHQKFHAARIRGEWFRKDALGEFLRDLRPPTQSLRTVGFTVSRSTLIKLKKIQAEMGVSSVGKAAVFMIQTVLDARDAARRAKAQPTGEK